MEKPCKPDQMSFVQLFTHSSIHPHFVPFYSTSLPYHFPTYLISNLWIDFLPTSQELPESVQCLPLNKKLALFVKKSLSPIAVTNIGTFMEPPEGWDKIQYPKNVENEMQLGIYIKRSKSVIGKQHVQSITIESDIKSKMKLETTQPTLTQNDDSENLQLPIHSLNLVLKIKKGKISLQNFDHISFQPHSEPLFMSFENKKTDLRTLSHLCYPKGVRIFSKPSGFQTYNFIMTLESGQRLYCYCLGFREKCTGILEEKILQMLGVDEAQDFFVESTFSLISQHNCTDQITRCLQALYKLYLSSKADQFKETVHSFPKNFTKAHKTSICKFESKILNINWKVNTSYPNTSNNAIYSVFKFLSVRNILQILEALLLEAKIFFISDSKALIGYAIESFLSFIFPLKWVHAIISIIPEKQLQLVQAPVPAIFGLSSCQLERVEEEFHSVEGLYVYLDHNKITDLRSQKQQFICLPKPLKQGLFKKLQNFQVYDKVDVRDYLTNPQNMALFKTREVEDPHFNPLKIRNIFLQLMVALLKNYSNYFIEESKKSEKREEATRKSLKKIYRIEQIKKHYKNEKFLCNFFQCTIFTQFIDVKYSQPSNKWIKFFDKARRRVLQLQQTHLIDDYSDQQESESQSETQKIPKGCLSLINMFSKESEEEKNSGKKKSKKEDDESSVKSEKKSVQTEDNPEDKRTEDEKQPETTEQLHEREEQDLGSNAGHVCIFFSFPYRKIANSRVGKRIGQRMKKLKNWLMKRQRNEEEMHE